MKIIKADQIENWMEEEKVLYTSYSRKRLYIYLDGPHKYEVFKETTVGHNSTRFVSLEDAVKYYNTL